MRTRKLISIIICLTVAAAVLIPAVTLFDWGDYLYCSLYAPANQRMMAEVLILAAAIAAVSFLVKKRKIRLVLLASVAAVFSYIHCMLLPVAAAGVYFLAVMSSGSIVTGISAVIIAGSLLSLAGRGTPAKLGAAVMAAAVLYTVFRILYRKDRLFRLAGGKNAAGRGVSISACDLTKETAKWQLLVNGAVLLVVLVQIGRASVAVRDFDSLWYGLRSAHVLAPGGSIFEDLGLVGMVYTYSKGYEILTLPLSAFRSYAYIPVFNTCLFIAGLVSIWKIVNLMCGYQAPAQAYAAGGSAVQTRSRARYEGTAQSGPHTKAAYMAVIITAVIPGIVNMCVSAKPDMVTWLLQLLMIERFFAFVTAESRAGRRNIFFEILAAYLLSLTMKPTAVIFSTALAGMMLIWWIIDAAVCRNRRNIGTDGTDTEAGTSAIVSASAAFISLCFVWGRTIKLTGVPFTSVFTGLLTDLGFGLKYPFSAGSIPTRFRGDSIVKLVGRRAARMLLSPEGSDMSHVAIAWSGSIMLVLGVLILIGLIVLAAAPHTGRTESRIPAAAAVIFIPYAVLCAATLAMLSQIDGNYYMTLYSIVTVSALWITDAAVRIYDPYAETTDAGDRVTDAGGRITVPASGAAGALNTAADVGVTGTSGRAAAGTPDAAGTAASAAAAVMIAFQFFIMLLTNWASAAGFTPVAFNKLYYDSRNDNRIAMTAQAAPEAVAAGDTIYDRLAAQPQARVLAVAEHPFCLLFECVVESYSDVANPWGNAALENSTEEFVDYLHFAGVDYIYADMDYLNREECSWRRGLLEDMTAQGLIYDHYYEGNTYLARVR